MEEQKSIPWNILSLKVNGFRNPNTKYVMLKWEIINEKLVKHPITLGQAPDNTWSRAQKVVEQIWSRYEKIQCSGVIFVPLKTLFSCERHIKRGLFLEAGYFWLKNPSSWMVVIKKLQDNSAVVKRDGVYLFNVTSILRIKCESQNLSFFFVRQKMDWFRFWKIYDCMSIYQYLFKIFLS